MSTGAWKQCCKSNFVGRVELRYTHQINPYIFDGGCSEATHPTLAKNIPHYFFGTTPVDDSKAL